MGSASDARWLGVDGGGSSTRALVLDNAGHPVGEAFSGPSNVLVVGEERAREAFDAVMAEVGGPNVRGVVAGFAGADRPWVRTFWKGILEDRGIPEALVVGDYRIAWAGLTDGLPGVLYIVGTGSVAYAESPTGGVKTGGYGWKIGDAGSGIELGRLAVLSALAHLEGSGPASVMTRGVLSWAQVADGRALLDALYDPRRDWRGVSELASHVLRAADTGDAVASAIRLSEAHKIVDQIDASRVSAGLPKNALVGLAGGLSSHWLPTLDRMWQDRGGEPLKVAPRSPVEGAARWAFRQGLETQ